MHRRQHHQRIHTAESSQGQLPFPAPEDARRWLRGAQLRRFDAGTPYVRKKAYTKRRNWYPEIFRVWGIPLMGLYPETMEEGVRPAIHEIAADLGLQCIDLKEVFNDSSYCIDGVHTQRKGTRMIAEYIFKERQRYDHTGIH